jgi:hypothetical protein
METSGSLRAFHSLMRAANALRKEFGDRLKFSLSGYQLVILTPNTTFKGLRRKHL